MATRVHHSTLAKERRTRLRRKELERIKRPGGLWYLAKKLGYGWNPRAVPGSKFPGRGLTTRLHKKVCSWIDQRDEELNVWLGMERGSHKTTLAICWMIRELIRNPSVRLHYYHNVDEQAEAVCGEVMELLRDNEYLRSLEPMGQLLDDAGVLLEEYNVIPRKGRWFTSSSIKTLAPHKKSRGPFLLCKGIKSEVTGSHCDAAWLDDIIAESTIKNSELPKIKSTYESTVMPVVDTKKIRASGTPWSYEGLYTEWRNDPMWHCLWVPGAVTDAAAFDGIDWAQDKIDVLPATITTPGDCRDVCATYGPDDYQSKARRRLSHNLKTMKGHFNPQVLLNAEPQSEKPWNQLECEHYTTLAKSGDMPGVGGDGRLFVLSDPAPYLQGSYKGITEKTRGDGTKDYWAIAVGKLRNRGDVQDIILLDGVASQMWRHQEGADRCAELLKKWRLKTGHTPIWISEQPDEHFPYMQKACRRLGVQLIQSPKTGPIKFAEYNKRDGKNARIARLAERAKNSELWMAESVPREFLEGNDKDRTGFLYNMRNFVRINVGVNSLRFDDWADVVSRFTDEALLAFAPLPIAQADNEWEGSFSPYREEKSGDDAAWGSRYIRL